MKTDVDSKIQMKSLFLAAQFHDSEQTEITAAVVLQGLFLDQLKCVGKNRRDFQSIRVFESSKSLFLKAHLFLSGTAVSLIKTST